MDHEEVLKEIVNHLSNCERLKTVEIFSHHVERAFEISLFSLFSVLENNSFDFISRVQKIEKDNKLSLNYSEIKPSLNEMYCMCLSNEQLFDNETIDKRVSQVVTNFMEYYLNNSVYALNEILIYSLELKEKNKQLSFLGSSYGFFACFYYYLFIVLEEYGFITDKYKPWDKSLIETTIYLPIEGMVNLVYFNFLINPKKEGFSELISESDESFNDCKISQYDCGFKGQLPQKLDLSKVQFTVWLDPALKKIDKIGKTELQKNLDIPLNWLRCFHVVDNNDKIDLSILKTIKLLHDTEALCNDILSIDHNIYEILANVDEGNYNVRGVWCNNLYGVYSTYVKSIVFRDLSLNQIDVLEKLHETIFKHIGNFANYKCFNRISNIDDSDRENLFKAASDIINRYEFNNSITDDSFSKNALVQLVAWQYLSEFYAYIKANLIITEYIISNFEGICKKEGYSPEKVPLDYYVLLGNLKLVKVFDDNHYENARWNIESFYNNQPVFSKEDIAELIKQTRSIILNYGADSFLEIRGEQNVTLRQFLTASFLLVKSEKGQKFFHVVPNFKFYGSSTQKNSFGKVLRDKKRDLKNVALASRMLEAQNQVFINPDLILPWNELIKQGYTKILSFMEEQIPILKVGKKSAVKESMKSQERYVTPYEVLLSLRDITINVFDKILDEILP